MVVYCEAARVWITHFSRYSRSLEMPGWQDKRTRREPLSSSRGKALSVAGRRGNPVIVFRPGILRRLFYVNYLWSLKNYKSHIIWLLHIRVHLHLQHIRSSASSSYQPQRWGWGGGKRPGVPTAVTILDSPSCVLGNRLSDNLSYYTSNVLIVFSQYSFSHWQHVTNNPIYIHLCII